MGWMYCGTDHRGREIGYGIMATCDRRDCKEPIDRGLGCVCGGMHNGDEGGCGRYYCDKHLGWVGPRGGCQHRGKEAWGKTYCQVMTAQGKWDREAADYGPDRIYCACHGFEYEGPDLGDLEQIGRDAEDSVALYAIWEDVIPGYAEHLGNAELGGWTDRMMMV